MAGGTATGQVIVVAASPILTRIYTPEEFGVLAVFGSLLGILGVVASLRYDLAIPLPEKDQEAVNVTALSLLVAMAFSAITAAVVIPFGKPIGLVFDVPVLGEYIWLLPLGLLLMGVYQVFNNWAVRKRLFPVIAKTKILQSSSMVIVQAAGYAVGPLALVVGRIFGQVAGLSTLGGKTLQDIKASNILPSYRGVAAAAAKYRSFPVYATWSGLLSTGGPQVPPILFSLFYGASAAGVYYLAHRVIALPLSVLGSSITSVFMPDAVEALREDRLQTVVANVHRTLSYIAMPPAVALFLTAPEIFVYVFGESWAEAGTVVRWLTPMLFFQFVVSPLSRTFTVLQRQRLGLSLHSILFALRMAGIFIPTWASLGFTATVFWYGLASCVGYIGFSFGISKIGKSGFLRFVKDWLLSFFVGFAVNLPLIVYYAGGATSIILFCFCALISAIFMGLFYMKLARATGL